MGGATLRWLILAPNVWIIIISRLNTASVHSTYIHGQCADIVCCSYGVHVIIRCSLPFVHPRIVVFLSTITISDER